MFNLNFDQRLVAFFLLSLLQKKSSMIFLSHSKVEEAIFCHFVQCLLTISKVLKISKNTFSCTMLMPAFLCFVFFFVSTFSYAIIKKKLLTLTRKSFSLLKTGISKRYSMKQQSSVFLKRDIGLLAYLNLFVYLLCMHFLVLSIYFQLQEITH